MLGSQHLGSHLVKYLAGTGLRGKDGGRFHKLRIGEIDFLRVHRSAADDGIVRDPLHNLQHRIGRRIQIHGKADGRFLVWVVINLRGGAKSHKEDS